MNNKYNSDTALNHSLNDDKATAQNDQKYLEVTSEQIAVDNDKMLQDFLFIKQILRFVILGSVFLTMLFVPLMYVSQVVSNKNITKFYTENWETLILPAFLPFCLFAVFVIFKSSRRSSFFVSGLSIYIIFGALISLLHSFLESIASILTLHKVTCFLYANGNSKAMEDAYSNYCAGPSIMATAGLKQAFYISTFILIIYVLFRFCLHQSKAENNINNQ